MLGSVAAVLASQDGCLLSTQPYGRRCLALCIDFAVSCGDLSRVCPLTLFWLVRLLQPGSPSGSLGLETSGLLCWTAQLAIIVTVVVVSDLVPQSCCSALVFALILLSFLPFWVPAC
jgi:hypothetical protein